MAFLKCLLMLFFSSIITASANDDPVDQAEVDNSQRLDEKFVLVDNRFVKNADDEILRCVNDMHSKKTIVIMLVKPLTSLLEIVILLKIVSLLKVAHA